MAEFAEVLRGSGDGFVERRTRHQFPDQTPVKAHLRFAPEGAVISDEGATVARFRSGGARLSQRLKVTILGICRMNDLALDRGVISVRIPPGGDVGEAVDRLGRVCARVAKLKAE